MISLLRRWFPRKRLALLFSVAGIVLMGVDLSLTRNFFSHIGELMVLSLLCFATGIMLDRDPRPKNPASPGSQTSGKNHR
ncbi:MAG: hypothetical protein ACYDAI_16615 [Trichloromonadaceae bacterium]